jgi:hypothetical protein
MNGVWRGEGFPVDWRVDLQKGREKQNRKLPRNNSPKHRVLVACVSLGRKDEERDQGKGSGAGQSGRVQGSLIHLQSKNTNNAKSEVRFKQLIRDL